MAVSGIGAGSSGRRRSLDAEVNLVPFIDLLSMCICFLLMAAVWTQLNSVQVKQSTGTAATSSVNQVDVDFKFMSPTEMSLLVKGQGKVHSLKVAGQSPEDANSKLGIELGALKEELARQGRKVGSVIMTPVSTVSYGQLVSTMDVFRRLEMINIGVLHAN